jgi:hypothetical protein
MIFDVLFFSYAGFGLGMVLGMFKNHDELYYYEEKLTWWQTAIFIVAMTLLWPLRFTSLVKGKGLMLKRTGQDVYREL